MCALARLHARSFRLHSLLGGHGGASPWPASSSTLDVKKLHPAAYWTPGNWHWLHAERIAASLDLRRADGPAFKWRREKGECLTSSHPSNAATVRLLNGVWVRWVCDCVHNFQRRLTIRSAVTWKKAVLISRNKAFVPGLFLYNVCEIHFKRRETKWLLLNYEH